MSNIQTGAERMPHDLSHLGFLAGQIGRLITISTTPVIAGDSFEMDAVGALRLSPLRRGLAIDSTVDIFTFYVPQLFLNPQCLASISRWITASSSWKRFCLFVCRALSSIMVICMLTAIRLLLTFVMSLYLLLRS